jgi:hypothetical protein
MIYCIFLGVTIGDLQGELQDWICSFPNPKVAKIAITGHLYVVSSQAMLRRNETAWARPHSGATGIKSNTGTSQTWEI